MPELAVGETRLPLLSTLFSLTWSLCGMCVSPWPNRHGWLGVENQLSVCGVCGKLWLIPLRLIDQRYFSTVFSSCMGFLCHCNAHVWVKFEKVKSALGIAELWQGDKNLALMAAYLIIAVLIHILQYVKINENQIEVWKVFHTFYTGKFFSMWYALHVGLVWNHSLPQF